MRKWQGMNWIRQEKRLAIYMRDNFTCVYCLKDLSSWTERETSLDHVIPWSKGGQNNVRNLVTACLKCNSSRGDRDLTAFASIDAQRRVHDALSKPLDIQTAKSILLERKSSRALVLA